MKALNVVGISLGLAERLEQRQSWREYPAVVGKTPNSKTDGKPLTGSEQWSDMM